jgi:hypothetical protein
MTDVGSNDRMWNGPAHNITWAVHKSPALLKLNGQKVMLAPPEQQRRKHEMRVCVRALEKTFNIHDLNRLQSYISWIFDSCNFLENCPKVWHKSLPIVYTI